MIRRAFEANVTNYRGGALTPEQEQIRDAFRSESYIRDQMDVQQGHIWDSLNFEADQLFHADLEMFTVPIGATDSSGRRKTFSDTSMDQGGQLINPEAFAIRRVLFSFSRSALETDVYSIAEQITWIFSMGRKRYLNSPIISLQSVDLPKAPIRMCDYCRSVYVAARCPGCGATNFTLSNLGCAGEAGRAFAMDLGTISLVIEQGINFRIHFAGEPHRLREPLKMWCHFEGLHARGIQ